MWLSAYPCPGKAHIVPVQITTTGPENTDLVDWLKLNKLSWNIEKIGTLGTNARKSPAYDGPIGQRAGAEI